jgi:hypothetical protein
MKKQNYPIKNINIVENIPHHRKTNSKPKLVSFEFVRNFSNI